MPTLEEMRRMFDATAVREREEVEEARRAEARRHREERAFAFNAKAHRPNLGLGYIYWAKRFRQSGDRGVTARRWWVEVVIVNRVVDATTTSTGWSVLTHRHEGTGDEEPSPFSKVGRWEQHKKHQAFEEELPSPPSMTFADALYVFDEVVRNIEHGVPLTSQSPVFEVAPYSTEVAPTPPWCPFCERVGWEHIDGGVQRCAFCLIYHNDTEMRRAHDEFCEECRRDVRAPED